LRLFHSLTWIPFSTLASELLACFLFLALYSFQGAPPDLLAFWLVFRALLFAILLRDSFYSIAIRASVVNDFFDLFFEVLTILDLDLLCTFWVLNYFTASKNEKQVLFAQFFIVCFRLVLRTCVARSCAPQWVAFMILLHHACTRLALTLTIARFLLYSI
jgi:hypothetical protein